MFFNRRGFVPHVALKLNVFNYLYLLFYLKYIFGQSLSNLALPKNNLLFFREPMFFFNCN